MAQLPAIGDLGTVIVAFLIAFIIYLLVVGFVLWAAGEIVVGRRVTFGQAFAIAGAGTFLVLATLFLLGGSLLGLLVAFLVFLALIRHYFKTGWLAAIGVTIMAVIVAVVIAFVLGLLAIGLFSIPSVNRLIP